MTKRNIQTHQPDLHIRMLPVAALIANPANARKHPPRQIDLLKSSIQQFGFVAPILIGAGDTVIAGHGRLMAARALGIKEVPTVELSHLTAEQMRTYSITDNRSAEKSSWDFEVLAKEIKALDALNLDFGLEITGFQAQELDELLFPVIADSKDDTLPTSAAAPTTLSGDIWQMGEHKLLCGDATVPGAYAALMGDERARMSFADQPFNVPVERHIRRRTGGHREFAQGAGEMTSPVYKAFLLTFLTLVSQFCVPGAVIYSCSDWRHLAELFAAGAEAQLELLNLAVWIKTNSGLGGFYRSQHEHVAVFKKPGAKNVNTFGMGRSGRHRTNVWSYPGVSSFGVSRDKDLDSHPTPKPTVMIADAIKDVSHRGDIVLDPFGGSGSTLIAAEKTRRKTRLIEIDAAYCDSICERFQAFTGHDAILAETGETFATVRARRQAESTPVLAEAE